ncbi:hypothetical protein C4565_02020 [Candidatus Parcubacteria bacterium]|nr:MAG: hypothetical protein C4565_02020 [Candidatus Parcubacteria bacterium]
MKLFRRNSTQDMSPVCKICGMEFTEVERMMRHMAKAHSKPCKGGSCGCS